MRPEAMEVDDIGYEQLPDEEPSTSLLHLRPHDRAVIEKIEHCISVFIASVSNDEHKPVLRLPTSSKVFKIPFTRFAADRVAKICRVLCNIHAMLMSDTYSTKRDLYYQNKALFGDQAALDRTITLICELLEEPRHRIHILSTARGLVIGELAYEYDVGGGGAPATVSCRHSATPIGSHVARILRFHSGARFILVIEKDATFQKLVDEGFLDKYKPCILITGKGYPDLGTREMTKKLVSHLHVPLFCLVDADVHGVEIMTRYKYGPKVVTEENKGLELPSMKWIGVFRSETFQYPLTPDQYLPLTDLEMVKIEKLRERTDLKDDLMVLQELSSLERSGTKVEIEAVSNLTPSYLTDQYLPAKLEVHLES